MISPPFRTGGMYAAPTELVRVGGATFETAVIILIGYEGGYGLILPRMSGFITP